MLTSHYFCKDGMLSKVDVKWEYWHVISRSYFFTIDGKGMVITTKKVKSEKNTKRNLCTNTAFTFDCLYIFACKFNNIHQIKKKSLWGNVLTSLKVICCNVADRLLLKKTIKLPLPVYT